MTDQIKHLTKDLAKISDQLLISFPNENAEMRMTTIRVDKAIDSILMCQEWLSQMLSQLNDNTGELGVHEIAEYLEGCKYAERLLALGDLIQDGVSILLSIRLSNTLTFVSASHMNAYSHLRQAGFWLKLEIKEAELKEHNTSVDIKKN